MNPLAVEINAQQRPGWTEQERQNVALVTDFMQHLMNEHDFAYVKQQFGQHNYVQHNPTMTDEIQGVINTVSRLVKQYPDYSYDVKRIFADGDHVSFHSHVTMNKAHRGNDKKGFNIMDTWRIQDGQIVEHWDAIQPLDWFMRMYVWLTGGARRNGNGVF